MYINIIPEAVMTSVSQSVAHVYITTVFAIWA